VPPRYHPTAGKLRASGIPLGLNLLSLSAHPSRLTASPLRPAQLGVGYLIPRLPALG